MRKGHYWENETTVFMQRRFDIPDRATNDNLYLVFDLAPTAEGLVKVNGKSCGAIDNRHDLLPIRRKDASSAKLDIEAELWIKPGTVFKGLSLAALDEYVNQLLMLTEVTLNYRESAEKER